MQCNVCGVEFDPADLTQVVYHETHRPTEVITNSKDEPIYGVKVADICQSCGWDIPVAEQKCSKCGEMKKKEYEKPTMNKNDLLTDITF